MTAGLPCPISFRVASVIRKYNGEDLHSVAVIRLLGSRSLDGVVTILKRLVIILRPLHSPHPTLMSSKNWSQTILPILKNGVTFRSQGGRKAPLWRRMQMI
jgi:hypothetical protein